MSTIRNVLLVVVVAVLVTATQQQQQFLGQQGYNGGGAVPPYRPLPPVVSNRRQLLTPVQQSSILTDVQQHQPQHRFAFPPNANHVEQQQHQQQQPHHHHQHHHPQQQHQSQRQVKQYQPNKSPNFQVDAAISKQLPTQTTILNLPRPQPHQPFHQQQQPQHLFNNQQPQPLQSQNNFRTVVAPSQAAPIPNDQQHHVQHHTQTNFIPNFAQQQQQQLPSQQQPLQQRQQQSAPVAGHFNSPFSGPQPTQQLSQQFHQQPLNQRSIQYSQQQQQQHQQQLIQQKPFLPSIQFPDPSIAPTGSSEEQRFVFSQQQQPQTVQTAQQIQQALPTVSFQPQQQSFQTAFLPQQPPQQQQPQQQQQFFNPAASREDEERIREKQKIIQKHEQFVQKQYQKQQSRVKQQHEEFLAKQRQIKEQSPSQQYQHQMHKNYAIRSRNVQPFEADAFQRAVKVYQDAHPTTTTTPRPTKRSQRPSTRKPSADLDDADLEQFLKTHRQKLYGELRQEINGDSPKTPKSKSLKQGKSTKALGKDDLLKQLKLALAENPQPELGNKTYDSMDIVLPDGQKVQVIRTTDPKLIEGAAPLVPERLVRPAPIPSSTENPKQFYEQLANGGLLPTGANFEVIRQSSDGQVQTLDQLPPTTPQKKVTFVYLEEQTDGTFKVQGVKSNGDKEAKTSGVEVDSIVSRIQNGDIKLPPSSAKRPSDVTPTTASPVIATTPRPLSPSPTPSTASTASFASTYFGSTNSNSNSPSSAVTPSIIHYGSSPSPYSTLVTQDDDNTIHLASASSSHYPSSTPSYVSAGLSSFHPSTYNSSPRSTTAQNGSPTPQPAYHSTAQHEHQHHHHQHQHQRHDISVGGSSSPTATASTPYQHSPTSAPQNAAYQTSPSANLLAASSTAAPIAYTTASDSTAYAHETVATAENTFYPQHQVSSTPAYPLDTLALNAAVDVKTNGETVESSTVGAISSSSNELSQILKGRGLHAMAKYLRQSGLDSILNETGPYTVFAPTDKAFKNLLVQLGGPERAEEKFRSNPRLLSGLLLHHVIPGSFVIRTLQDEMTGVSLAGTQLRVNQYNLHDTEWNDITITTINGAMIVPEKNDIVIPQGIAHAVDRVMFPLPVGDILQTLQSDRERRFTTFLKALTTAGMSELLQNKDSAAKTYTVFAPIDAAFANSTEEELQPLLTDKEEATKFVMRHISSGTLFSAGMRFYQVRDALNGASPITIQKTNNGKVKINDAVILSPNIPTTNGVIHAIDTLL